MWPIVEVVAKISKNQILFNIEVYWILSRSTLAILSTIQLQYILAKYSYIWLYFEKKVWPPKKLSHTPFFLWCCFKKITSWLLTKRTTSKIKTTTKENIRLPATAKQPKNISRFRPYKKEKTTTKKKLVKSKLHTLKTRYVLLTKTDNFISTIVTKNRKVPFYLNGLFIKTFFCLYYTAWLRKAQRRIGQIDPQV